MEHHLRDDRESLPEAALGRSRTMSDAHGALLEVRKLSVCFRLPGNDALRAVYDLSYSLCYGETLAIVGESGAGKSVSCRALIGLLPEHATVTGSVQFRGTELLGLDESEMRRLRGARIAIAFQDADRHLNPTMRIGEQIAEAMRAHQRLDRRVAQQRSVALLERLGLPAPVRCFRAFPHQVSGGMRQRALLAIALACNPNVLIADESTRAVDTVTRAQVLSVLAEWQQETGMGLILVTHDLALAERFADDLLVMRAGEKVEHGRTRTVFAHPRTPYTRALLLAAPRRNPHRDATVSMIGESSRPTVQLKDRVGEGEAGVPDARGSRIAPSSERQAQSPDEPGSLLEAKGIVQEFRTLQRDGRGSTVVQAIADVSFDLRRGEALGVIGESGAGKSTLVRALLQEPRPNYGQVLLRGRDLTRLRGSELRNCRRRIQVVLQDAVGSLNPKWRVAEIVEEPLRSSLEWSRAARRRRVSDMLELVGLPAQRFATRRPRELSGGQCQRVAIARALAPKPDVIIFDEAVSSLDRLVQAQVLDLLHTLRTQLDLSYLFISHDLAIVEALVDRVAVLHRGQLCEIGPTETVFRRATHPYTIALLASTFEAPARGARLASSDGHSSEDPAPAGCRYQASCSRAQHRCATVTPRLQPAGTGHMVACHFPHSEADTAATVLPTAAGRER